MTFRFEPWLSVVVIALAAVAPPALSDDIRLWQEGDVLMTEQGINRGGVGWKFSSAPSSTRLQGWEIKPKVQWRWRPGLDSAVTYKLARGCAGDEWSTTQTIELDLAQSWPLSERTVTRLTHRLGVGQPPSGDLTYRYHFIPRIEWRTGLPRLTAMDTSWELIHDVRGERLHESKFSPLRLRFDAGHGRAWLVSYILNHRRVAPADWHRDHVLQFAVAFETS